MWNVILAATLQLGAVLLGHLWGLHVGYPGRPPTILTTTAGVALFLLLLGWWASLGDTPGARTDSGSWVCAGSFGYALLTVGFEPFFLVHHLSQVLFAAAWLVPFLLAIGHLVREQEWISVAGLELFVFTSVAMLTSNTGISDAGSGFFAWWG
jgi:hypothetical protein